MKTSGLFKPKANMVICLCLWKAIVFTIRKLKGLNLLYGCTMEDYLFHVTNRTVASFIANNTSLTQLSVVQSRFNQYLYQAVFGKDGKKHNIKLYNNEQFYCVCISSDWTYITKCWDESRFFVRQLRIMNFTLVIGIDFEYCNWSADVTW